MLVSFPSPLDYPLIRLAPFLAFLVSETVLTTFFLLSLQLTSESTETYNITFCQKWELSWELTGFTREEREHGTCLIRYECIEHDVQASGTV